MNLFQADAEEVLRSLGTTCSTGLTQHEVERRRREYGPNAIEKVAGRPLHRRFIRGFTHFFALLLWLAAAVAFLAEIAQPGQGMATLGHAIVGVIVVNGLFAFWQEYRVERTLSELARLLPLQAKVRRESRVELIASEDLVPGDVVFVEQGDRVSADCRLVEAFALRVSNATVTGEATPLPRTADPCDASGSLHSDNVLLAGTSVLAGDGVAVVFATGRNTEFGNIARLAQTSMEPHSRFLDEIAFVSRLIAVLAIGLGIAVFFVGMQAGLSAWQASMFGIGIIVANVPEGLLPTITLALAMGAQRMSRRGVLIRHLTAVETLGAATVICTDKTGTLTENRMAVRELFLARTLDIATPDTLAARSDEPDRRFCEAARWCQTLKRKGEAPSDWLGDPMEIALVQMAENAMPDCPTPALYAEIPFDASRKRMSTICDTADGLIIYTKGAPEAILPLCVSRQASDGISPLTAGIRQRAAEAADDLAIRGLRVLALAYRILAADQAVPTGESELILLGLVAFEDPPRDGVRQALAVAQGAGIKVIMTTGDHPSTALAIAHQIGLVNGGEEIKVVTGDVLRRLSEIQLQVLLDGPAPVFARLGADQKLKIVRALRAKGHVVAVTGDGVNDAPALREADIGVAMGRSGSDVAREAADIVLVDDNFANIVQAIEEGRTVFENVRKFMTYILTSNIPELVPYLAFALFGIPLPLTIIQILVVDLGTDLVPALGLGAEKPHPDLMKTPPRARTKRLLDWPMLFRAYLFLGPFEALTAMSAYFFVLFRGGWSYGDPLATDATLYLQATTACLAAIILVQVVNVFLCRDDRTSSLRQNPIENPIILAGIAIEAALIVLIVYTGVGNAVVGTASLPPDVWLFALPFAALMFLAEEARKWFVRRTSASPET